jgi:hypothetical protein
MRSVPVPLADGSKDGGAMAPPIVGEHVDFVILDIVAPESRDVDTA